VSPRRMSPRECGTTARGVTYCYIPELGVRFCPRGARTVEECRVAVSGDRRRGRWERRRVGVDLGAYVPRRTRRSRPPEFVV